MDSMGDNKPLLTVSASGVNVVLEVGSLELL